ncbi:Putative ATP-dependent DNA helicase YjcD [Corynebacterium capitovis DSM 44611]|uniref:ATP-dependent DNA helicase n=1 Tax=Corynebacterium capitovis TaxID=131081 RepID=UPI00036E4196|nr:ATP-dependent DNA helicase [Corynebacterium capitovis]WKD57058.1 Putative ATP-dependent DNA helicase YjcD [Corynebacterium capitovis DSM 44611]
MVQTSPTPRAFLVARQRDLSPRSWDRDFPTQGVWKVTGDAGSGVTSFLIDATVDAIESGAPADGVLVISTSKESGARVRAELSDRLAQSGFASSEPLVRSIHSLAFALLRAQEDAGIRLISGAEQDAAIRQLLQGHAADGRGMWPEELRPALSMVGFSRQLRDFLLRAVERRLGPADLLRLGEECNRSMWAAAGDFLREYQQVMALSGARMVSASELVAQAAELEFPHRWHTVVVDDAQHLDPASGELVRRLVAQAHLALVGGNIDQSVFHFRGASPDFFRTLGGLDHETIDLGPTRREPRRRVAKVPSQAAQDALLADVLRRAHFEEGVSYREMAVIVRSAGLIEPTRRALLQAGVPVALAPTDVILSEERIVVSLMLALRALGDELAPTQWRDLLLGPVGGTDPVTLRRLLRGLRRWNPGVSSEESLQGLLAPHAELPDFGPLLTERELDLLMHVRGILEAGRASAESGGSVEEILWAVWNATGLSNRLLAAALRGGATGSQADRDLDSVMALFDAAGDFTERRARAGVDSFVAYIEEQVLPTGVRDRRAAVPDAVVLLTAHGAAGREFRRVIVAGVQELVWPSLGETGTMFGQEDLMDLIDRGVDPAVPISRKRERLEEEERLFRLATGRATEDLLVTAVNDPDAEEAVLPSQFVEGFSAAPFDWAGSDGSSVLTRDHFIAQLRRVVNSTDVDPSSRRQAARQLARLADAGVPGADPTQWWTMTEPSTAAALPVRTQISPSRIESLLQCPLRSVLERMVGFDAVLPTIWGSMAHAYFEAVGRGVDEAVARRKTVAARTEADTAPRWKAEHDIAEFEAMLERASAWLASRRETFEQVAVEAEVDVEVASGVSIRGRVDRIEREESGALHIIDFKTGSTVLTDAEAANNPQLKAYQLALARGVIRGERVVTADTFDEIEPVGGAQLVYPKRDTSTMCYRQQAPQTEEQLEEFTAAILPLPQLSSGPLLTARTGTHCERCAVRALCPVQPEGQVIFHA